MSIKLQIKHDYTFNNQNLFNGLSDSIIKELQSGSVIMKFGVGESIFNEGEMPLGIYRVKKGMVKKFTSTSFASHHIFYICKEDEFLGYHAVISHDSYVDSATALVDSEIEFIPKKTFMKALDDCPKLQKHLFESLGLEFRVFVNATKVLAKYTVRERTALNLLILENKFKSTNQDVTEIIINRDDLASMVGTAKESVVRTLKEFKEDRLITTKRSSIFIKDYDGLVKASYIDVV
ncbi:Crp/Fnr family transcriptional regulator [Psychroserpens sp. XS_ASV72]|uniref:Crp/Fnr family transcriptional regulator n=1 Tax=Psychroserpens sp. XS_ASV72 TaxID=3241293 RepID=UPI00351816E4